MYSIICYLFKKNYHIKNLEKINLTINKTLLKIKKKLLNLSHNYELCFEYYRFVF